MDISQLEEDYQGVRNLSLRVFETDINPIRCHEMAYLIAEGMKWREYGAVVVDGVYQNRFVHSWVKIPRDNFWSFNPGILIDFQFHPQSIFFAKPLGRGGLVKDRKKRRDFKKRHIEYELAKGIESFAEHIFPE